MHQRNSFRLEGTAAALLAAALMLLVLPLKWLLAAAAAAIWHELCHCIAVRLCGGTIVHLRIGAGGAVMQCTPLPPLKQLLCTLAGPLGSLLLLVALRWIPRTAVCAFLHALYNLLPIYPLDGGRALRTAVSALFPQRQAYSVCHGVELCAKGFVAAAAMYFTLALQLGFMPVLLAALLLIRMKREKSLANC